jgi:predicted ferric reductase
MNLKTKSILGWFTIIIVSLIPVLLFYVFGTALSGFSSFSISLYTLGRTFALIGVTLFTINFVLSTRLKFLEEVFGGMDKVYLVHGITGGTAFMFILAHPLLILASSIPTGISSAAVYLIPSGILYLDFGLIAIILLISLMFVTFFTRMKYNHWKFTHEFLGVVFIFVLLHIFFLPDGGFYGYYVFISIIAIIGLSAFIYSLVIRKKFLKYSMYKIKSIKDNKDYIFLELEPKDKSLLYQSGQFVFMRFYNEKISREPHPFSIASESNSQIIKIFIKKLGDFTEKLNNLKVGDEVSLEGPYGKFNFKNFESKNQIWLAAGIGITPFLGMIDELKENPDYKIDLLYTFKDNYIIDKEVLDKISRIKNLKFLPWNSQKRGRIKIGKIIEIYGSLKDKEILICGPLQFKEEIIRGLKELGIKKEKIHEEVFELK